MLLAWPVFAIDDLLILQVFFRKIAARLHFKKVRFIFLELVGLCHSWFIIESHLSIQLINFIPTYWRLGGVIDNNSLLNFFDWGPSPFSKIWKPDFIFFLWVSSVFLNAWNLLELVEIKDIRGAAFYCFLFLNRISLDLNWRLWFFALSRHSDIKLIKEILSIFYVWVLVSWLWGHRLLFFFFFFRLLVKWSKKIFGVFVFFVGSGRSKRIDRIKVGEAKAWFLMFFWILFAIGIKGIVSIDFIWWSDIWKLRKIQSWLWTFIQIDCKDDALSNKLAWWMVFWLFAIWRNGCDFFKRASLAEIFHLFDARRFKYL